MHPQYRKLILVFALVCALFVAFGTASVHAQDATPQPNDQECIGCHEGLRGHWENSPHGKSTTDPKFQLEWKAKGSDPQCLTCHTTGYDPATGTYQSEGVSCLACHSPVPASHPDNMMPTDDSAQKCGSCHKETYAEWETSNHGAEDMTCNQCHNPHTSEVRAENSQELCKSCHNTETHYYAFTGHAEKGLLCTDCHLRVNDAPDGSGHSQRHHTFKVDLNTCNACHAQDMHAEVNLANKDALEPDPAVACYPAETVASINPTPEPTPAPVTTEPAGPSPLVYVVPAGIGLVFGTMIAPWVGRMSSRRKDEKEEGEN